MRALIVSQTYFPFLHEGGRPTKVRAIAEGLAERGHHVTVLTSQLGELNTPDDAQPIETFKGRYGRSATLGAVDIVYLPALVRRRTATVNRGLLDFCSVEVPAADVVHIFGLYDLLGPVAAAFTRRRGVPYLLETMGMFPAQGRSRLAKAIYHGLVGRRLMRDAERIVVSSAQEHAEVASRGIPATQIVVRRNGVSAPGDDPVPGSFRRAHGISTDARVALFLSRLVPEKGIELLLRAFARALLREWGESRQWVLVVAGPSDDSRYLGRLTELAATLGVRVSVKFVGALYGQEKWAALRDATFLVQPSLRESFGNSIAEAIASGTPVIATDVCGVMSAMGGVARKAALLVTYDEEHIAEAMLRLGSDEQLRQELSAAGTAAAAALDWKEPLDQLEALYEELLASKVNNPRLVIPAPVANSSPEAVFRRLR